MRVYESHFDQFPTLGAFLAAEDRSPSQAKLGSPAPAGARLPHRRRGACCRIPGISQFGHLISKLGHLEPGCGGARSEHRPRETNTV